MDDMKLRPAPLPEGDSSQLDGNLAVNRRQFMRHGFNAAGGVLAATLGALGFAAILMPPAGGGGGDQRGAARAAAGGRRRRPVRSAGARRAPPRRAHRDDAPGKLRALGVPASGAV